MEALSDKPDVLYITTAKAEDVQQYFSATWPEARAVSDPKAVLFQAFGLERARVGQLFGPKVWVRGLQATLKGHFIGAPKGDPWRMPGYFLVDRELEVLWSFSANYAGQRPDWSEIPGVRI